MYLSTIIITSANVGGDNFLMHVCLPVCG